MQQIIRILDLCIQDDLYKGKNLWKLFKQYAGNHFNFEKSEVDLVSGVSLKELFEMTRN